MIRELEIQQLKHLQATRRRTWVQDCPLSTCHVQYLLTTFQNSLKRNLWIHSHRIIMFIFGVLSRIIMLYFVAVAKCSKKSPAFLAKWTWRWCKFRLWWCSKERPAFLAKWTWRWCKFRQRGTMCFYRRPTYKHRYRGANYRPSKKSSETPSSHLARAKFFELARLMFSTKQNCSPTSRSTW